MWMTMAMVAALVGCGSGDDGGASNGGGKTGNEKPVSFLVSCDTNGWIVPCGCTAKQSGGLLRRGTMAGDMSVDGDLVVLDVGGAAAGNSEYHRVKFEAILRGELEMGIAAHNIGTAEAKFGADTIREIRSQLKVPFISANVFDAAGDPIAPPFAVVEKGGRRFAVIGILDPSFAGALADKKLTITNPKDAILKLLTDTNEKFEGTIVLAYSPREALLELASQLPEVDVVLGGPTGQTVAPTKKGATLVAATTNKGKFVVQLSLDSKAAGSADRWNATIAEVDDTLADDPAQVKNLDNYHTILGQRDFNATETGLHRQTGAFDSKLAFVGNSACVKCHVADCTHFETTKHAIAWPTLQGSGSHVDPYCQQCHTTGYGRDNGFVTMAESKLLFNVGCESCHGPSSEHAALPEKRTPYAAKEVCAQCHDRENSPAFEYKSYWAKIVHGAKVVTDKEVEK